MMHFFSVFTLEAISKKGFWLKIKAAANIKPEEYTGISRI